VSGAPSQAEVQVQWKAYFATLTPEARRVVRRLLREIKAAAPNAVAVFSYRIPGYRLLGQPLLWAAGFKRHVGLYPVTARLQTAHSRALSGLRTSTGTVQFPLKEPLPLSLVRKLIRGRIAEVRAAAKR
jgi:uncharacterized protein YdhG (YjbR/CyaY superfamily)